MLIKQNTNGKCIAAICAAPALVLAHYGILEGKKATCYPAAKLRERLSDVSEDPVVIDGHIITSQGPGTALQFSLALVELLYDAEMSAKLRSEMIVTR
jgi:4-methyl-5(b-hydroxyethyl)-thiazole monophosphate biosynthesis